MSSPKGAFESINEVESSTNIGSQQSINVAPIIKAISPKIVNPTKRVISKADQLSSWSTVPFNRKLLKFSKDNVDVEKIKKKKKSIEDLLGLPKAKKGGKKNK